jgi:hypothetical protein
MPRTFNTAIQGEIDKQYAGEPMVLIEIEWVSGNRVAYTDQKLNGANYPHPWLISVTQFDSTQEITGSGDTQQITITMNDIDGELRSLIDSVDVHLRPVRVYLTFQGLPLEEKALLFEGVINSPIVWDEGGRTLTFDVMSKLESVEAGFTMEDGDFPYIDPTDRNKPWPLVFGQVCNMEAVQVRGTRKGFLGEGVGVKDPTIDERLCQARHLKCAVREGETTSDGGVNVGGPGAEAPEFGGGNHFNVRTGKPDEQCLNRRFNKICEILTEKEQQEQWVKTAFVVRGGNDFPQEQLITIQINEVRFDGIMSGETFTVAQVYHPDAPVDNPPCQETPPAGWGYRWGPDEDDNPTSVEECQEGGSRFNQTISGGSGESWEYFNAFKRTRFIWLPPGTEVLLADEAEVLNIVSLMPGTVNQVAAYRNFADTSLLMAVPTDLYTVVTTDFGGYDVVEVRLNAPLSTIQDEDWDDEIYVSFTSSVGPNPADVVKWLVETYTDLTMDTTSYNSVKSDLANYPSNFYVKARPRVLDLISDVAYQARCAVFIRDNVVYMAYLSKEPTSVRTLTEDDILPNSFRISHTTTEDLKTRHTISWSEGDAGVFKTDETDLEFVLKHNVPKYGIFDAKYDYYTMNIFELVEKSSTFWMIRESNTWKQVEFSAPLTQLNLDIFDAITINLQQFQNTKVVIEEAKFDLDSNTIQFRCWTPIRSGEDSEYLWAWPSQQDPNAVHPLVDQTDEPGDGFGLQVIPPEGHPLRGSYDPDSAVLNTDGDKRPSDLDDALPTLVCKIATGAEIEDAAEPDFDPFEPLAEDNFKDKLDGIESGGTNGGSTDDGEDQTACGDPGPGNSGCVYEVNVIYVTPQAVCTRNRSGGTTGCLLAGPCGCGVQGRPCFGPQHVFCHSFGAAFAATSFASGKAAEASALWESCGYQCGVTAVLQVMGINAIEGTGPEGFNECDPIGDPANPPDPDAPGAKDGETQKPKCNPVGGSCDDAPVIENPKDVGRTF